MTVAESVWMALDPTSYPREPYRSELRRGIEQYVLGKGVERCWMEDRKTIGNWFDGAKMRPVEEVLWLSPKLVSRWFGYEMARAKWSDADRSSRWQRVRATLEGRLVFLVRLSAYPKRDFLNPEEAERPSLRNLDEIRFLLTQNGAAIPQRRSPRIYDRIAPPTVDAPSNWSVSELPVRARLIASLQGREPKDVEGAFWPNVCPLVDAFEPEFLQPAPRGLNGFLGDYHARIWWVEAKTPANPVDVTSIELRVISPSKERIATFRFH